MVTSPATPPYSSTAMAMWMWSCLMTLRSSAVRIVSGTKMGLRSSCPTGR